MAGKKNTTTRVYRAATTVQAAAKQSESVVEHKPLDVGVYNVVQPSGSERLMYVARQGGEPEPMLYLPEEGGRVYVHTNTGQRINLDQATPPITVYAEDVQPPEPVKPDETEKKDGDELKAPPV